VGAGFGRGAGAWDFLISTKEVEKAAGQSVAEIFENQGEAAFREMETAALKKARAEL